MWTDENKEAFLALVEPLLRQQQVQDMQVKTLLRNGHFASITSFISGGRYKTAISNKRVEVFENKITVTIYIHHK